MRYSTWAARGQGKTPETRGNAEHALSRGTHVAAVHSIVTLRDLYYRHKIETPISGDTIALAKSQMMFKPEGTLWTAKRLTR
jgi:hypothetical protein